METIETTDLGLRPKPLRLWPSVMIDIETLGTGDSAAIIEIGAVGFDRETAEMDEAGFSRAVSILSNSQAGRGIDGPTLLWWMRRWNAGHPMPLDADCDDLPSALQDLALWLECHWIPGGEIWAKGDFDCRILAHAMESQSIEVPWKFYQVWELRSIMKWEGAGRDRTKTAHSALEDARAQTLCVLGMAQDKLLRAMQWERTPDVIWGALKRDWEATHTECVIPAWDSLSDEDKSIIGTAITG